MTILSRLGQNRRVVAATVAVSLLGGGAMVAVNAGGSAAPATVAYPADPVGLRHYGIVSGDTWAGIVAKFCNGTVPTGAIQRFQSAAQGNSLTVGRVIHVLPSNCDPTPPPTTTILSTTTTSTVPATTTTVPPTTTTAPPLGDVAAIPSNFDITKACPTAAAPLDPAPCLRQSSGIPGSAAPDVVGAFRFLCYASHVNYDDPITKPGVKDATHLHLFFGNTLTDANSTYQSLRTTGQGTCNGGPVNRSAYWAPVLCSPTCDIGGNVLLPNAISVYYKQEPAQAAALKAKLGYAGLPRGLKMVGGYDLTGKYALPSWQPAYWACESGSSRGLTIPTSCPTGDQVVMHVEFPSCWDGRLDSPNHRDHIAYYPNGDSPTVCPADHPLQLPRFSVTLIYSQAAIGGTLASDNMPGMPAMAAGSTLHADWFGAWDDGVMATWFQKCVIEFRSCVGGQTGDDKYLADAVGKTGTLPIPVKG